jgi:two-component system chemotaxis sensor kinase CheA
MEMDISQYKELFVIEANEHLDYLNKCMLELENDPGNLEVINEIFRSAHTLKGMAATMGYEQLTELAHETENLLEQLRVGDTPVDSRVIDTLLACLDTIGAMVNGIEEDRKEPVDYVALVSRIRGIAEVSDEITGLPEGAAGVGRVAPVKEASVEETAVEAAPEAEAEGMPPGKPQGVLEIDKKDIYRYSEIPGMRVLRVTVTLDEGCLLKSVRVFMVFKKIAQLGEVISSLPSFESLEDEKFESSFQVGLATYDNGDKVKSALTSIAEIASVGIETVLEAEKRRAEEGALAVEAAKETPVMVARRTQSVRVNISRLDKLMNLVGELVINRTRLDQVAFGLEIPELREALDQAASLTAELQEEIMKTRMVPVENIFNRFPRMVRDLAKSQNKDINFVVEGKEIELDRTILDEISDPLMHMIRNAVDHGITNREDRRRKEKPESGVIKLSAYRDRNFVAIEVEDDGEGIDLEESFDLALKEGLISEEERRQLTADSLLDIISISGFTTSEEVSGVSGRGVGMDYVKAKVESLGGFVVLDTVVGRGTKITLKLPLTLAIVHALMVEVADETYAIPLGTVSETQVIDPTDIKKVQNQEAIFLRERTIPLVRLDNLLGIEKVLNGNEPFPVVITEVGTRLVGIGVHELLGQQEIVINSLDRFLKGVEGFAGATILGTGRVALILDIHSLLSRSAEI